MSGQYDREIVTIAGQLHGLPQGERVTRVPIVQHPPPVVLGADPSGVPDQTRSHLELSTWVAGMGAYRYTEGGGDSPFESFTDSDCETRWPGVLTCRPLRTARGTLGSTGSGQRVEYTGMTGATLLAWAFGTVARYFAGGTTWTTVTGPGTSIGAFARGFGYVYLGDLTGGTAPLWRSTDNITYAQMGAAFATGSQCAGIARHDNKLWALVENATLVTLYSSVNPDAAVAANVAWVARASFRRQAGPAEGVYQLFEWRNKYGDRALYALTSRRILGYDEDADVWKEFFEFPVTTAAPEPQAHVWKRDDNLYVCLGPSFEYLYQFTGTNIAILSPNLRGGMPPPSRVGIVGLGGNAHFLFLWAQARTDDRAAGGFGRFMAMNDQQGFHTLYHPTADDVIGGGWGADTAWTVLTAGTVWEQPIPDIMDSPILGTARSYDTAAVTHETAWFYNSRRNVPKGALGVLIQAVKDNGTVKDAPGLPTGATLAVAFKSYLGTTTTLATLTDATIFPAQIAIPTTTYYKEGKLLLTLTRGTAVGASPFVTLIDWQSVLLPTPKYAYQLRIDPEYRGEGSPLTRRFGLAPPQRRAALLALPGTLTTFSYGGGPTFTGPNLVSVNPALVTAATAEDPITGLGPITLTIEDLSAQASG